METLMESTGWRDLVVHLTEGAVYTVGEWAIDALMVEEWRDEIAQDALWDDVEYEEVE